MRIDENRAIELLTKHDKILILTHTNPDGDTLGCGTALCHVLRNMGKLANVVNSDEIPRRYSYLFEGLEPLDFEPEYVVAVDIADTQLLGDNLYAYKDSINLCIDHHGSNCEYADELFLCPEDGAAALTIYRLIKKMGAPITKPIANALYTGMSTDTGCFRYSNANSEIYRAAADLIDLGADNPKINTLMFETKSPAYFKLLQEVLNGMRVFCDGKCVVLKVTQEMFNRTGGNSEMCDAIAAMSRQMEGALCGITMKEREDGHYKFSLRSHHPIDSAKICSQFGGGGHMRAAGCEPEGDAEKALQRMLDILCAELSLPKETIV